MTDLPSPTSKPTHDCDLVKEGDGLTCPAGLPVPRGTVLTRSVLRSVAVLVLVAIVLGGLNLLWTAHEVRADNAAQQRQEQQEQQEQQRAGALLEQKLCTTFGKLAANKPPAGNPATNPSRRYDQNNHAILDELGADLGCRP